ncbi:sigma 54-interacting transcriptional regulator [Clostridiaceae bacterium M8S5]|nr:sigma 54-interacting transcriptional regulator [Clostridiaceae bacterium M8S5]
MNLEFLDIIDVMNEGIIYIDRNGIIKLYSEKAREILGLKRECKYAHEEGKVKNGDIVIMGITALGVDDGQLSPNDFKMIGIDPVHLKEGYSVACIGRYGSAIGNSHYKTSLKSSTERMVMKRAIDDLHIEIIIDFVDRYIDITINGTLYRSNFNNDFGHMVIVDGQTKKVKFYQSIGYTAWKEDIKSIINKGSYYEKKIGINEIVPINTNILQNHKDSKLLQDFIRCAKGSKKIYKRQLAVINGFSVLCGMKEVKRKGQTIGAVLLIEDISKLKNIENQRNIAYKKLQKVEAGLDSQNIYKKLFPKVIGSSDGIIEIKKLAYKASKSNSNVLILGESGTGKTVLARAIHEASDNKNKPFIQVNCNSIPESLLESELFGYEKGAFTGANIGGKKGYFEMANGGTLFLDEIGDISKNMQVKLLEVIQSKKFYKVGGNKEKQVDVRIIAATNRNLENEVKNNNFREDLYYRINVFPIQIIPLRQRKEDIYELVEYLIPKICERVGTKLKRISGEAYNKLMMYSWPGNIRELENVLERAVNLCDDLNILSENIMINIDKKELGPVVNYMKPLKETMNEIEKEVIKNVMIHTKGNKKEAMEILKIKKSSFYKKLSNI